MLVYSFHLQKQICLCVTDDTPLIFYELCVCVKERVVINLLRVV